MKSWVLCLGFQQASIISQTFLVTINALEEKSFFLRSIILPCFHIKAQWEPHNNWISIKTILDCDQLFLSENYMSQQYLSFFSRKLVWVSMSLPVIINKFWITNIGHATLLEGQKNWKESNFHHKCQIFFILNQQRLNLSHLCLSVHYIQRTLKMQSADLVNLVRSLTYRKDFCILFVWLRKSCIGTN